MPPSSVKPDFVVVEPRRTCCDHYARPLDRAGRLRFLAVGTRRGVSGVRAENTRRLPALGLVAFGASKVFSNFRAESIRFGLHPWIDRWALKQMQPGDHVLSSYGYANACFKFARANGGRTFLDAGNSHPDNFWTILSEELRRWNSPFTPVARHHYERSLAMLEHTDYILAPSSFVANSFLERGFAAARVFRNPYPVDLSCFSPASSPRPKDRPLTVISTGRLSLRKGTPYMLEAFRLIRQRHPSARFLLTSEVETNALPVLEKYRDLPIEWSPNLPHPQLAERLRRADVFVLTSLEEGFVQTVAEAMACGLPVVVTPNTGTNDLVTPGENGEIVPIRDVSATAEAILRCHERVLQGWHPLTEHLKRELSLESFAARFLNQLDGLSLTGER